MASAGFATLTCAARHKMRRRATHIYASKDTLSDRCMVSGTRHCSFSLSHQPDVITYFYVQLGHQAVFDSVLVGSNGSCRRVCAALEGLVESTLVTSRFGWPSILVIIYFIILLFYFNYLLLIWTATQIERSPRSTPPGPPALRRRVDSCRLSPRAHYKKPLGVPAAHKNM